MQFSAAIASAILGASFALAAPLVDISDINEYVKVSDLEITRAAFGKVTDVFFKLPSHNGTNLACSVKNPTLGYEVADSTCCGDSDYFFNLLCGDDTDFALAVFISSIWTGLVPTVQGNMDRMNSWLIRVNGDIQSCKSTQSPVTIISTGQ